MLFLGLTGGEDLRGETLSSAIDGGDLEGVDDAWFYRDRM